MTALGRSSRQYRSRYAAEEIQLASAVFPAATAPVDYVLAIPASAESSTLVDGYRVAVRRVASCEGAKKSVLVLVVVNGRVGADDSVFQRNRRCFEGLRDGFALHEVAPGAWRGADTDVQMIVIDRYTQGRQLPADQGVGLARKVGADLALELIVREQVRTPFIAMSDGDATLPDDYFERIANLGSDCSAAMFPFWHEPSGDVHVDRATAVYEIRLRYHVRALRWAESPYAFQTMGSTLVVNAESYAGVRGMPQRQAGEDFYFLDKLSKIRPLARLSGDPVVLRSRVSDRVPFGTGAATNKLLENPKLELYAPKCFEVVREVNRALVALARLGRPSTDSGRSPGSQSIDRIWNDLGEQSKAFLTAQGARGAWLRIAQQAPSPESCLRRLREWFDGFRTLKLIHHVRDDGHGNLPMPLAIEQAPFMDPVADDGGLLLEPRRRLLAEEQSWPRLMGPGCISRG